MNGQQLNISQVLTVEGVTRLEDDKSAPCLLNDGGDNGDGDGDDDEVAEWAPSFMVALAPS